MNTKTLGFGMVLIAVVLIALYVGSQGQNGSGMGPDSLSKEPIKIGGISALTGVGSAIGEEERRGAALAVEEINAAGGIAGRPLQLTSEDVSIDKMKNAATVAQKLIAADEVVAIVGPQWDEPAEPILPIIEKAKVPMIGPDTSDQLEKATNYEYFFSTWYDNRVGIRELLRYAQKRGWKNIAIIRPIDGGFWKFTADTMLAEASSYGVNIVDDIDMGNPLILDFRTPILKVKAKKPDAVFIVTSDYNQCTFLKQANELGLNVPKLGTESSGDFVSLKNCPKLLENSYFSSPKQTVSGKEFIERFKAKYGDVPKFPSAVTAYDAVRVLAEALKKTNGEGAEKLRDAIATTHIAGASLSDIKFNSKGFIETPEDAFEMMTARGGQFVSAD